MRKTLHCPIALFILWLASLSSLGMRNGLAATGIEGIPDYPGSQKLCEEHVTSASGHISWRSFATEAEPAQVAAYFEGKLGVKTTVSAGTYALQAGDNSDLQVVIAPGAKAKELPSCGKPSPPSAKTLIVVSQRIRGKN